MGMAIMGTVWRAVKIGAVEAAQRAISSPLLERQHYPGRAWNSAQHHPADRYESFMKLMKLIIDSRGKRMTMLIYLRTVIRSNMHDEIRITVIATGFDDF